MLFALNNQYSSCQVLPQALKPKSLNRPSAAWQLPALMNLAVFFMPPHSASKHHRGFSIEPSEQSAKGQKALPASHPLTPSALQPQLTLINEIEVLKSYSMPHNCMGPWALIIPQPPKLQTPKPSSHNPTPLTKAGLHQSLSGAQSADPCVLGVALEERAPPLEESARLSV